MHLTHSHAFAVARAVTQPPGHAQGSPRVKVATVDHAFKEAAMFDFQQLPSRTGGTIARLSDGDVHMQVAFHAGECSSGTSFLRICSAITVGEVERFSMQYHMDPVARPYIEDEVCKVQPIAAVAQDAKAA